MEKEQQKTEAGRRITFRLSHAEWQTLETLRRKSNCNTVSSLIRKSLFEGRIKLITYDRSLDMVMEELSKIRQQIQAIGVNINQVTRRFHNDSGAEAKLFSAMEITRLYQQTDLKVTELLGIISNLSKLWLPG